MKMRKNALTNDDVPYHDHDSDSSFVSAKVGEDADFKLNPVLPIPTTDDNVVSNEDSRYEHIAIGRNDQYDAFHNTDYRPQVQQSDLASNLDIAPPIIDPPPAHDSIEYANYDNIPDTQHSNFESRGDVSDNRFFRDDGESESNDMLSNKNMEVADTLSVGKSQQRVDASFVDDMYDKYHLHKEKSFHNTELDSGDQTSRNVEEYSNVLNDIDSYEAKNKFKGKPKLPSELNEVFSGMAEEEKVKILLKLTDQTMHDKVTSLPEEDSRKGAAAKVSNRKNRHHDFEVPPDDSKLLYATANNNFRGMYSDSEKMMQHSRIKNVEEEKQLNWKNVKHVDVNGNEDNLKSQVKAVKNAMDSFEKSERKREKKHNR